MSSVELSSNREVRDRILGNILNVVGSEWKCSSEILDEVKTDFSDSYIRKQLIATHQGEYIDKRPFILDPRQTEYRITRKGAEWVQSKEQ